MDKNGGFPVRKLLVDQRVTPQIFGTAMSKSGVTRGQPGFMEGFITMERTSERSVLMFQLTKAKPHMLKLSSPENSHHLTSSHIEREV